MPPGKQPVLITSKKPAYLWRRKLSTATLQLAKKKFAKLQDPQGRLDSCYSHLQSVRRSASSPTSHLKQPACCESPKCLAAVQPDAVHLWRRQTGWSTVASCAELLKLLRDNLQPILLIDCAPANLADRLEVVNAMGLFTAIIRAGLASVSATAAARVQACHGREMQKLRDLLFSMPSCLEVLFRAATLYVNRSWKSSFGQRLFQC